MSSYSDNFDGHTLANELGDHADWNVVHADAAVTSIVATAFGGSGNSVKLTKPQAADATARGVVYVYDTADSTDAKQPATGNIRIRITFKWASVAADRELFLLIRTNRPDSTADTDLYGTDEAKDAFLGGVFTDGAGNAYLKIYRAATTGAVADRTELASAAISPTSKLTGGGTLQFEVYNSKLRLWFKDGQFDYTSFDSDTPDLSVSDYGVAQDKIGGWGFQWRGDFDQWIDYFSALDFSSNVPNTPSVTNVQEVVSTTVVPMEVTLSAFSHPSAGQTHVATRWQIDSSGGSFDPPSYEEIDDTVNKTSKVFHLPESTTFEVRVAFKDADGNWSSFSTPLSFDVPASGGAGASSPPLPTPSFPAGSLPDVDQGFSETREWSTRVSEGDKGAERRSARWSDSRRIFTVSWSYLSETELGVLMDFFDARKGKLEAFQFTHPLTAVTYAVRFMEDAAEVIRQFHIYGTITVRMIEVIEPSSDIYGI